MNARENRGVERNMQYVANLRRNANQVRFLVPRYTELSQEYVPLRVLFQPTRSAGASSSITSSRARGSSSGIIRSMTRAPVPSEPFAVEAQQNRNTKNHL